MTGLDTTTPTVGETLEGFLRPKLKTPPPPPPPPPPASTSAALTALSRCFSHTAFLTPDSICFFDAPPPTPPNGSKRTPPGSSEKPLFIAALLAAAFLRVAYQKPSAMKPKSTPPPEHAPAMMYSCVLSLDLGMASGGGDSKGGGGDGGGEPGGGDQGDGGGGSATLTITTAIERCALGRGLKIPVTVAAAAASTDRPVTPFSSHPGYLSPVAGAAAAAAS
mmetsp:Transcript_11595/g.28142  ORF Transcript_11595/g.28142 Transcript_11595/m.28142 type:complete len:221 (-) Transcript_11595:8990-9652(-)